MAKTKTKAKTKRPVIDDEDDDLDVIDETPVAAPAAPVERVKRPDAAMVLDMDGIGAEVAAALVVNGLRAYLATVNKGASLVAANRAHTAFVPVKAEECFDGLDVRRDDARALVDGHGVLAFLLEAHGTRTAYYVPVSEYMEMAEDRGESGLRLDATAHAKWLEKFAGHPGVKRAFARLLA